MGCSVGAFFVESLSVRASGSVRDQEVPTSASIDSRVSLKEGTFGVSVIPRAAFVFTPDWCASSPPALSPSPLGVTGLFAVCARSSAPFVWIQTLLELGAQHTYLTSLSSLHPAPRATGERGARARQHRLRSRAPDMYPTFKIYSGYIRDTFRIQCILHLRYMAHKIHSRYK